MSKIAIIPNHKKGTIEFHYDLSDINSDSYNCNFVEFCIDSEIFYNYLLYSEGDSVADTDPFYAKVITTTITTIHQLLLTLLL